MRITRLTVSNFLGLEDFALDAGKIVLAKGPNATGKTSIIKAIRAAFEGEKDPRVIHHDGDAAEVFVQLDDGTSIRRVIAEGGQKLEVLDADGEKVAKPQSVIKALLGALAFNPVEFYALSPRERKEYLLRAIEVKIKRPTVEKWCGEVPAGVDLDQHGLEVLKALEEHYFEARKEIHAKAMDREGGAKEIAAELPEGFEPAAARQLNVATLMDVINRHEAAEAARAERHEQVAAAKENLARGEAEVEQLAMRVARAKQAVESAREAVEKAQASVGQVAAPPADEVRMARDTLAEYDKTKKVLARHEEMTRLLDDAKTARNEWGRLDALVKFLQVEAPKEVLAKLPPVAKGLKIDGETLALHGTPLDQLSSAEQLCFAVEVARAMAGDLKLLCVDGIERLDPEAREAFLAQCKGDEYQYVLTEVAGGKMKVTSSNGDPKKAKAVGRKA